MPTTSVRRLTSPLSLSSELVEVQLGAMCCREFHVGQYISLGLVHGSGKLGQLWAQLICHFAPLCLGRGGIVLGKGGGDEGGGDTASLASRMGQKVAHGMHPTALPGGVQ